MFCNCFQSEASSIMANDMTFHTIGLALSEFEITKLGNPKRKKKKKGLDSSQQNI